MDEPFLDVERALRGLLPLDFPPALPVYLVSDWDAEGIGPQRDRNGNLSRRCNAWTAWDLDVRLQSFLEERGLWRGRGFATVISESLGRSSVDVLVTTLHEAAHYLDYAAAGWCDDPADVIRVEQREYQRQREVAIAADAFLKLRDFAPELRFLGVLPPLPPWTGHPPGFLRAALHVRARALAAGFDADWLNVEHLCLADPLAYWLLLEGEAERRLAEPLRDVLADDPPSRFTEFAAADYQDKTDWWDDVGADFELLTRAVYGEAPVGLTPERIQWILETAGRLPRGATRHAAT